jgi:hypothetical protein
MCQFDNTPHLYWIDLETLLKANPAPPALCTILFLNETQSDLC